MPHEIRRLLNSSGVRPTNGNNKDNCVVHIIHHPNEWNDIRVLPLTPMEEKEKFDHYYRQKKSKAAEFTLTKKEMRMLLDEADITAHDIGIGKEKYCLGRIGDVGPYAYGNCRFITNEQNRKEVHDKKLIYVIGERVYKSIPEVLLDYPEKRKKGLMIRFGSRLYSDWNIYRPDGLKREKKDHRRA